MAVILENKKIASGIFMMKVQGVSDCGKEGQFFMLSVNSPLSTDPLLKRPISIYDSEGDTVTFVYRVVGRGTEILANMKEGDTLDLLGPLGNGFTLYDEDVIIIGGGIGIAPLYKLAREHALKFPDKKRTVYLGFTDETFLLGEFSALSNTEVVYDVGGFVTDKVDFSKGTLVYTCGPEPMMRAVHKLSPIKTIVSTESRMACGVGACLGCTIKTINGNRRVCKDGPVFLGDEVFYE
ncbi:MAG: dihydroorotate dehydrogenase electron transfer subunit [Clostridia bacterium]|nr:dihydroorotate dehydrogenase electron transfer subunit [Clostridia bacterium]